MCCPLEEVMQMRTLYSLFIFTVSLLLYRFACAAVIFEDNFNGQPDWQPRPASGDLAPAGRTAVCDYSHECGGIKIPPIGWTQFRATGWWWGPTYQDTIRITNQADHGEGGKSFIVYNEANNGASGDGWGADGLLTKLFDQDYQELYLRVWLRTQPGWRWDLRSDMMIKIFRVKHFDRTGSIYTGFSGGTLAPILIWDFKHSNSWGTRYVNALRCDPQENSYYCSTNVPNNTLFVANDMIIEPNAADMPADTNWHRLDFHVAMNTYDSQSNIWNADGVYEFIYDGKPMETHSDVLWKRNGSDPGIGWNAIALGGNAHNSYNNNWSKTDNYNIGDVVSYNSYNWRATQANTGNKPGFSSAYWTKIGLVSSQIEQWYALDDVVVSTTPIPSDYVIGGGDEAIAIPTGLKVQ